MIKKFFIQNRVTDIHRLINNANQGTREGTFHIENNCINIVAVTDGLMQYIDGCKFVEVNSIINTDH